MRKRLRTLLAVVAGTALLSIGVGPASADPLTWSAPSALPGAPIINAVDCPTPSLCVAVGTARPNGSVILVSTAPANPSSWTVALTTGGSGYNDVSCPTADFCIAIRSNIVATSTNPAAGAFSESAPLSGLVGTSISCPSPALCVTNGYRNVNWNNTYGVAPFTGNANWTAMPVPPISSFNDISCLGSACLAVSDYGIHATNSAGVGVAFTQARFPGGLAPDLKPSGISCVSSVCMLVTDGSGFPNPADGGVYVSTDRTTWTRSTLPDPSLPAAIDCVQNASALRCVTATFATKGSFTDTRSVADTDRAGATAAGDWSVLPALFGTTTGGSDDIRSLGCASPTVCLAFSFDGRVSVGSAPGGSPTEPGTTPAPAPGARTAVTLKGGSTKVVKRGKAVFALQGNPGEDYVANLVTMLPASSVRSTAAKRISVKLGSAKGTFSGAGAGKATVKLSAKGKRALKRLGKLKATLRVTSDPRGVASVQRFTVTLKRGK
ncbi:MAG TPA: hypothetical protein PKL68_06115 [Actinomycetota bacterium]|nr:hypothetical protein [Actinomycetota bacterium]HNE89662.1 hypothetical protein [Actinomycetota bacterium]HNL51508.1 hypothetical protein [Actinomycetota bacterium]HNO16237.1 hypothetical protein [Actinomycetota bacterium]HUM87594.1 hypothetical protein [Actinomycetota bacterium]